MKWKQWAVFVGVLVTLTWAATLVAVQRIVIIGDSTVCNYAGSKYPWAGWGQELSLYFKAGTVTVINKAIGGRSSRSYIEDGSWASTKALLQTGDILMIQFGHNDRDYTNATRYTDTSAYKLYLAQYVTEARALGVHPVFVTPMNMNTWTNATTVREVFCERSKGADYRGAMIRVADSLRVPVLDLEKKSKVLMDTMGQEYMAKFHFMGLDTGEYANYPTGSTDGTHFQELGALENARMITEEIARQPLDSILSLLAPKLAPTYLVTVITNLVSGGTMTHTRHYPQGATITLKVKPATGKVFLNWLGAQGAIATTALRYTFVQGVVPSTWQAVFAGTAALPGSSTSASSSSMVAISSSSTIISSSSLKASSSTLSVSSSSQATSSSSMTVSSSSSDIVPIPESVIPHARISRLSGKIRGDVLQLSYAVTGEYEVRIFQYTGALVQEIRAQGQTIPLSMLGNGYYIVEITQNGRALGVFPVLKRINL